MTTALETFGGHHHALNYVWDVATLAPALMTQPGAASGGGDASAANQVTGNASLASIDGKTPALGQQLAAASSPVVLTAAQITTLTPPAAITGFATETTLGLRLSETDFDTKAGNLTETAPATDTASSGLNGRLQRIAQRLTSLIALLPTALVSNRLDVNLGAAPATVTANATLSAETTKVIGTINVAAAQTIAVTQATPASLQATVTNLALSKGTQGATGVSTQDLKDAGRVIIAWTAEFSPAATAEALLTLTESRDGAATTTFTTKVITSGKRLRLTSVSIQVENTLGTALQRAYLRMRVNTAGAVTTASPLQGTWAVQALGTVKSISPPLLEEFPDGFEILGDGTKQIGFTLTGPDWVTGTSTLKVYITLFGFEY